jgi:hypothetical protein
MLRPVSICVLAAVTMLLMSGAVMAQSSPRDFRVRDDCDPASFNAAVGAGTCVTRFDGDTTFEEFIEELTEDREVGAWRFNPDVVTLDRGQRTVFESRGGEFHTFTRVARFGGGIVPDLNELSGTPDVRSECGAIGALAGPSATNLYIPAGARFVGPSAGGGQLPRGTTRWQCCIHPWMRSTVTVR